MGGAVDITVRATTALFSHLIINSIDAHLCFSLSVSLTQSLASLFFFFFFRTLALNLNSGSLGVSLLLMRPSLVNSYRAPLVDTEGGGAHHKGRGHHHKRNNNVWMGC